MEEYHQGYTSMPNFRQGDFDEAVTDVNRSDDRFWTRRCDHPEALFSVILYNGNKVAPVTEEKEIEARELIIANDSQECLLTFGPQNKPMNCMSKVIIWTIVPTEFKGITIRHVDGKDEHHKSLNVNFPELSTSLSSLKTLTINDFNVVTIEGDHGPREQRRVTAAFITRIEPFARGGSILE